MEKLLIGDCLEKLNELPDNSIDSVVTDPPYGLSREPNITEVLSKWLAGEDYKHSGSGFMGKTWDSFVPGPSIWKEVYRVLKPGGHLLCFAGTRTEDLMSIAIRLAGFERRDEIEWLYFSGFSKAMDVGKAFDRRRNEDKPKIYQVTSFVADCRDKAGKTNKDIDKHFGTVGMACHWTSKKSQPAVPKWEQWLELKKLLNIPNDLDQLVWELNERKGKPGDAFYQREKIGESKNGVGNTENSIHRQEGFAVARCKTFDVTAHYTPIAKQWDGWKTALKPAHEPILVFRKPLENNVCCTVEKYGTGALNIDGCRIPTGEKIPSFIRGGFRNVYEASKQNWGKGDAYIPNEKGRFPANCITLEDDQFYSKYFNITPEELSKKASKKDRNSDWEGKLIDLPERKAGGLLGRNNGSLGSTAYARNTHPTVKPIELMAWLIKLVTQPGGVVLDPFAGSGSTLVAAKKHGFGFIGVELNEEYAEIIKERIGDKKTA